MLRPRPVASSWAALALAAAVGCDQPGGSGPQPVTCVQVAGTWELHASGPGSAPTCGSATGGRCGSRATVLDVHPVERGDGSATGGRTAPRAGHPARVSGGTAHGIGLEAPPGSDRSRARGDPGPRRPGRGRVRPSPFSSTASSGSSPSRRTCRPRCSSSRTARRCPPSATRSTSGCATPRRRSTGSCSADATLS